MAAKKKRHPLKRGVAPFKTFALSKLKPRTSWSYTHWTKYKLCPFQYGCAHVWHKELEKQGIEFVKNDAMKRGEEIHETLARYLTDQITKLPNNIGLQKQYHALKHGSEYELEVEQKIAVDKNFKQVDYFSKSVYARFVMDVVNWIDETSALVVDHKTGGIYDYAEYEEQFETYVIAMFKLYPGIKKVHTALYFVDHDEIVKGKKDGYTKTDFVKLEKKWLQGNIKKMLNDVHLEPRPNKKCNWCSYSKAKGGPCKY